MVFFKIFRRRQGKEEGLPLRVEGVTITLTPEPDEAEEAAEALLTAKADVRSKKEEGRGKKPQPSDLSHQTSKSKAYYQRIAQRIREGREMEARMTMRLVAYCEQELKNPLLPEGRIAGLESSLYERLDIVEREGGELKKRWQHCLAEVTVRVMGVRNEE